MEAWNNLVLPNKLFVSWRNKIIDDKTGVRKKFKIWIRELNNKKKAVYVKFWMINCHFYIVNRRKKQKVSIYLTFCLKCRSIWINIYYFIFFLNKKLLFWKINPFELLSFQFLVTVLFSIWWIQYSLDQILWQKNPRKIENHRLWIRVAIFW